MMHDRTELIWEFLDTHTAKLDVLRAEGASRSFITGALIAFDWLARYAKELDDYFEDEKLKEEQNETKEES